MTNIKVKNIKNLLFTILLFSPALNAADSRVILDEEYVSIRVDKDYTAHVQVKFIFNNTMNYSSTLAFPVSDWFRMENFTALWNNEILDYEIITAPENRFFLMAGDSYRSVYKFDVPLTGSDTSEHIVSYSYKIPYITFLKDYETEGYYVEYILRTGSLWHGNVSRLNITVTSDIPLHGDSIRILDNSFLLKQTGLNRWEFTGSNIELTKNIRFLFQY